MSSEFYATDLADVHDMGYSEHVLAAAAKVLSLLRSASLKSASIVDLGCGSGLLAATVVQRGHSYWGVDISQEMVTIARRRTPQATFVQGSFVDTEFPPAHIVTSIGECLNYVADPKHGEESLRALFQRVWDTLHPGGIFLFDTAEPGLLGAEPSSQRIIEADEWTMFLDYTEDRQQRTLTRNIHLFRRVGDLYRKSKEVHKLCLYPHAEVVGWLEQVGFSVKVLRHYRPSKPFRNKLVGYLASKPQRG